MTISVSSAAFQKAFGRFREKALQEPITITNHGRDSLVLMSADEYRRLKRRDRMVLKSEDLSDEQMEAILTAEIAEEAYAFNHEVEP
jgi:PHD/YefM family antitoxin component YafN of YafNO toxin-antitoxin module